ncbi:MAG TPA: hypothetical protein VGA65_00990 [Hyphomicrobium sp.]|jgi:hypothetical protein
MSTIGYSNWAVDLKDVNAIYPFQGWEVAMVLAAVAFWLIWHIVQIWQENREYKEDRTEHYNASNVGNSVDRY